MDAPVLFAAAMQLLVLLLAISLHESAHAWTARARGDATAAELGRISLNPLRHLDPIGSIILPCLLLGFGLPVFGWGRPAPVLVEKLRDPARDRILVAAAGPAANLSVFAMAAVALAVLVRANPAAQEAAQVALLPPFTQSHVAPAFPLMFTVVQLASINAFLAVFNLVPVPPLDGGEILLDLMPTDWAGKYEAVRPYGFLLVVGLALFQVLPILAMPFYMFLMLVITL